MEVPTVIGGLAFHLVGGLPAGHGIGGKTGALSIPKAVASRIAATSAHKAADVACGRGGNCAGAEAEIVVTGVVPARKTHKPAALPAGGMDTGVRIAVGRAGAITIAQNSAHVDASAHSSGHGAVIDCGVVIGHARKASGVLSAGDGGIPQIDAIEAGSSHISKQTGVAHGSAMQHEVEDPVALSIIGTCEEGAGGSDRDPSGSIGGIIGDL